MAIDLFEGQWLHLAEYERPDQRSAAAHRLWLDALVQRAGEILGISPENCFIKRRTRQKGKSQYEKLSSAGTLAEVHENGLTFLCNMSDYLDVGLFLDHRITRSMVSRMAGGKRFLNLFCYTGSFTCAAAAGGAARTVSVDLSSTYLDWAEKNMAKNGFGTADQRRRHRFIRDDAIEYLSRCRETFDLCVCDPPTYSNSKKLSEDWDVQKRHAELLTLLAERMAPGGTVFFSNNFRRFKLDCEALEPFYTIRDISAQTVPEEYRNKRIHSCWRLMRRGE
ncbi:MAG: class I SAM-dependent methyltransferase [Thermoguttaceae bacterium]|nr:class I SAM-dependent methyltransferase [Thermoguttaceae bacterium]